MSDDLISRKALMEEIQSFRCSITGLRAGKGVLAYAADEYRKSILQIIDNQPIAFDKESVIEELTLHKKFADYKTQEFDEAGDVQNMEIQDFISLALQGAIRIVEKGGLN